MTSSFVYTHVARVKEIFALAVEVKIYSRTKGEIVVNCNDI